MKSFLILFLAAVSIGVSSPAKAEQCSGECKMYYLDTKGGNFTEEELPGHPIYTASNWKSLNDGCKSIVQVYSSTRGLFRHEYTLSEVISVNTLIPTQENSNEQLRAKGYKVAAVLVGTSGHLTEADACTLNL